MIEYSFSLNFFLSLDFLTIQYGNAEGYGPPSPATQFMMSPQANFSYNYGYGFSPVRQPASTQKRIKSPQQDGTTPTGGLQATITPTRADAGKSQSPATVCTSATSESLSKQNRISKF